MRLAVVAALLACTLLSCGQSTRAVGTTPVQPDEGVVSGTVVIWPCRPVERVGDPPCPPAPNYTFDLIPVAGTGPTRTVTTDLDGQYRATLRAGSYEAHSRSIRKPRAGQLVTVTAGATVTQNLIFDEGIR